MRAPNLYLYAISVSLLAACAGGDQSQSERPGVKQPAGDNAAVNPSGSQSPVNCESQWALAVKQQPKDAKFIYNTQIKASILSKQVERVETITASSASGISRSIVINDPLITQYVKGLASQSLTLSKTAFTQACQKAGGQPVAISGLGGDITVKSQADDVLSLNGQQIKVKRITAQASNVKYGGYTISADVIAYIAVEYPALPLKQTITINQASLDLLNGAVIQDQLKSALPTIK